MKELWIQGEKKDFFLISSYDYDMIEKLEVQYNRNGFNTTIRWSISPWSGLVVLKPFYSGIIKYITE